MNELIKLFAGVIYTMSIIYTFIVWGFWWGVLSLFVPGLFVLIDVTKYLIHLAPWL